MELTNKDLDGKEFYDQANKLFAYGKIKEGYEMMQKAAECGYAEAQYLMGNAILEMSYNRPLSEGIMWLGRAAENNHVCAINNLAMCYQTGTGVDVDYAKAIALLKKAAELGDMMAYFNIGQSYVFGLGVKTDILKGLGYIQRAAESEVEGCEHAMFFLGQVLESGVESEGISSNIDKAIRWYNKAADKGDNQSIKALQRLGVIESFPDDEDIAKQFMGMWLHYDLSCFDDIIARNLTYSSFHAPEGGPVDGVYFQNQDFDYFKTDMQNNIEEIINNQSELRCRLRKEDRYICDTMQNGQMISYELFCNSGKIYKIYKYFIEG